MASQNGHFNVIKWILVDGRDVNPEARWTGNNAKPAKVARQLNHLDIATLLEDFETNTLRVRHSLRKEFEIVEKEVSQVFALVIFVCDDYLKVRAHITRDKSAARFFSIMSRLPIELQMMICNRLFRSENDLVLTKFTEPAFIQLAMQSANWNCE